MCMTIKEMNETMEPIGNISKATLSKREGETVDKAEVRKICGHSQQRQYYQSGQGNCPRIPHKLRYFRQLYRNRRMPNVTCWWCERGEIVSPT